MPKFQRMSRNTPRDQTIRAQHWEVSGHTFSHPTWYFANKIFAHLAFKPPEAPRENIRYSSDATQTASHSSYRLNRSICSNRSASNLGSQRLADQFPNKAHFKTHSTPFKPNQFRKKVIRLKMCYLFFYIIHCCCCCSLFFLILSFHFFVFCFFHE